MLLIVAVYTHTAGTIEEEEDEQSMRVGGIGSIVRKSAVSDDSESTEEKIRSASRSFRMSRRLSLGLFAHCTNPRALF